ncbi:MAG: SUMF1/EgtB/PvdO family nonheme iron enzyme [Sedimentisphaerales bacterium]|nr:SUMF1/EgtB/PvdO family nonheme iron enzyme [Sedimentisphaerales bacterium]
MNRLIYSILVITLLTSELYAEIEDQYDSSEINNVKITIGSFKVTNKKLEIRYQIQNKSKNDIWICDGLDFNPTYHYKEVYMDRNSRTLFVRSRLNVPMEGYGPLTFGKYVRLRRGENLTETLSLDLPVHYRRYLSGGAELSPIEYATRLVMEVGYYTIDLPHIIKGLFEEIEKIDEIDDDDIISFPDLGLELDVPTLELMIMANYDPNDKSAIIPYTFQKFKGEHLSRIVLEGLQIPYQEIPLLKREIPLLKDKTTDTPDLTPLKNLLKREIHLLKDGTTDTPDLTPLENLQDLFYESAIEAEQYMIAEIVLSCPEQLYDETTRKIADIYNKIGKGEESASDLERLLNEVAEKHDRDRVIKELVGRKEEKERQLLDIAKANDNKIHGRQALSALDELLTMNPNLEDAFELRQKISSYYRGDTYTNSIGMKLVWIPPGDFLMGAPTGKGGLQNERPQHEVRISKGFWMGAYEVTQAQYESVMEKNPSFFKGDNLPVEMVSWNDAMEFCRRLSQKEGKIYRLPTEAEWEYACRANTTTQYSWGDEWQPGVCNSENFMDNDPNGNIDIFKKKGLPIKSTMSVGSFKANSFGLYDMHGNVREWCRDWYEPDYYLKTRRVNPEGPDTGRYHVVRGGSWQREAFLCRSSNRDPYGQSTTKNYLGFRVICRSTDN